jgi:hypothetical protein
MTCSFAANQRGNETGRASLIFQQIPDLPSRKALRAKLAETMNVFIIIQSWILNGAKNWLVGAQNENSQISEPQTSLVCAARANWSRGPKGGEVRFKLFVSISAQ